MKNSAMELKCFAPWLEMILTRFIFLCKVAECFDVNSCHAFLIRFVVGLCCVGDDGDIVWCFILGFAYHSKYFHSLSFANVFCRYSLWFHMPLLNNLWIFYSNYHEKIHSEKDKAEMWWEIIFSDVITCKTGSGGRNVGLCWKHLGEYVEANVA